MPINETWSGHFLGALSIFYFPLHLLDAEEENPCILMRCTKRMLDKVEVPRREVGFWDSFNRHEGLGLGFGEGGVLGRRRREEEGER